MYYETDIHLKAYVIIVCSYKQDTQEINYNLRPSLGAKIIINLNEKVGI